MLKKYIVPLTLTFLAGLYLGCTSPQTVVDSAKNIANPTVPAGNATSNTSPSKDATGYWLVEKLPTTDSFTDGKGHLAMKQASDGKLVGEQSLYQNTKLSGTSTEGTVAITTWLPGDAGGTSSLGGTISDDGSTLVLSVISTNTNSDTSLRDHPVGTQYKLTRLF